MRSCQDHFPWNLDERDKSLQINRLSATENQGRTLPSRFQLILLAYKTRVIQRKYDAMCIHGEA